MTEYSMDEGRRQRIKTLATTLAGLRLRQECARWMNLAGRTHQELVDIAVDNALLEAEINDTQLLLNIETAATKS